MFEFDKYEGERHTRPPARPVGDLPDRPQVTKASFMLWSEHCIECAAPACFSSCDLYDPRPDKRCRRFEYGLYPNEDFRSDRGAGAEVVFRRWGKLEALGNVRLMPVGRIRLLERLVAGLTPLSNLAARILTRLSGDFRANYATYTLIQRLVRRQRAKASDRLRPDGFLAEIYNPGEAVITLHLTMTITRNSLPDGVRVSDLPPPFVRELRVAPGFSSHFVPLADFRAIVDSGCAFDVAVLPEAEADAHLVFQRLDFVGLASGAPTQVTQNAEPGTVNQPAVKCVVFDLDKTVWDGVLLEGDQVRLRPGLREVIKTLDKRGILLSVASKNAHAAAWAKLGEFGLAEYFIYPKINWLPKSQNVRQIARDINIGLDTFVFVDDNPFELQEVGEALPEVTCWDAADIGGLLDDPRLAGSTSAEAGQRRRLYQETMVRDEAMSAYKDDYTAFLRACDIRLRISPFSPDDFERTAELVQRTNQLNFSGHKYDREQLVGIVADEDLEKWVLRCEDKFGSYGTVGFCIARRTANTLDIEDLMLSCRVQGKFIEQALFAHLGGLAGPATLRVNFHATDRNGPAQQVLDQLGFAPDGDDRLVLAPENGSLACDFIQVESEPRAA